MNAKMMACYSVTHVDWWNTAVLLVKNKTGSRDINRNARHLKTSKLPRI
jgi:hypothetical protein